MTYFGGGEVSVDILVEKVDTVCRNVISLQVNLLEVFCKVMEEDKKERKKKGKLCLEVQSAMRRPRAVMERFTVDICIYEWADRSGVCSIAYAINMCLEAICDVLGNLFTVGIRDARIESRMRVCAYEEQVRIRQPIALLDEYIGIVLAKDRSLMDGGFFLLIF